MKNLLLKVVRCAIYTTTAIAGGVMVYTGFKLTNDAVDLFIDEIIDHGDSEVKEVENEPQ